VSCAYIGAFETNRREINDRIIGLICVNCGASEKWLPNGTGKLFKDKHNPRLDRVMRNFEKLDDYLQEYVIKQLDILVEFQEKNKSNR
jgi:predicted transcriptional regulator YheO